MSQFLSTGVKTLFRGGPIFSTMTARQQAEARKEVVEIIPPSRYPAPHAEKACDALVKRLFSRAIDQTSHYVSARFDGQTFLRWAEFEDGTTVAIFESYRGVRYVWTVDPETLGFVNLGAINE